MKLSEVKHMVSALNFQQIVKLDTWLHSLIKTAEHAGGREAMKYSAGHKTYRSEMVSCGKERCKCAVGHLHGPYWYAYWSEDGKTKSQYVGKHLPRSVKPTRNTKPRSVR